MVPMVTPAPRTPKVLHAAGARIAASPQSPPPASGNGVPANGSTASASVSRTCRSMSTVSTAGSPATARTSSRVPVKARALTSQNERTGDATSSATARCVASAVRRSVRSSTSGRPSYRAPST